MIVKAIMELIKVLLLFVIGLFPSLPDMSFLVSPLQAVGKALAGLDYFVDVKVFGLCVLVTVVMMTLKLIWGVIMWVVRKIPGVS